MSSIAYTIAGSLAGTIHETFKYIIVDGFMFYAGLRRKFLGGYKVPWA